MNIKYLDEKLNRLDMLYAMFFHVAVMASIFQLICPIYTLFTNIRIDYICIVGMVIIIILETIIVGARHVVKCLLEVLEKSKIIVIACGAYFIWDTINLLYANDKGFLLDKYLIWAKISVLCVGMILYINPPIHRNIENINRVNYVLLNLGISNFLVCITAVIGYYTGIFTMRIRMLTTISDHNVFSSMIMIGFICLCYVLLFNKSINLHKTLICLSINMLVCVPVMYLSASRRTIVLLWFFLGCFLLFLTYIIVKDFRKTAFLNKVISLSVAVLIVTVGCLAQIHYFNEFSTRKYEEESNIKSEIPIIENDVTNFDKSESIDEEILNDNENVYETKENEEKNIKEEVEVDEYVQTIIDGTGLELRKLIWKTSIEWFNKMSFLEKIIGGGASYQSDIFDDIDNPLNKALVEHYNIKEGTTNWMGPHNFLLEDLLSGGIVKLIIDLCIMFSILICIYKLSKINFNYALLLLSLYAVLFANLMMGGKYGIFGDRLTWIVITVDIILRYSLKDNGSYKI